MNYRTQDGKICFSAEELTAMLIAHEAKLKIWDRELREEVARLTKEADGIGYFRFDVRRF